VAHPEFLTTVLDPVLTLPSNITLNIPSNSLALADRGHSALPVKNQVRNDPRNLLKTRTSRINREVIMQGIINIRPEVLSHITPPSLVQVVNHLRRFGGFHLVVLFNMPHPLPEGCDEANVVNMGQMCRDDIRTASNQNHVSDNCQPPNGLGSVFHERP